MDTSSSFAARRSAASHLPAFQLPPPDAFATATKYTANASYHNALSLAQQHAHIHAVLTPPAAGPHAEMMSPVGSSVKSDSSTSSSTGSGPTYQPMPYYPSGQQQQQQQHAHSAAYGNVPSLTMPFAQSATSLVPRPQLYSPPATVRAPTSPSTAQGLAHPPFEVNYSAFPTNMSMSGSSTTTHGHSLPSPHEQSPNQSSQLSIQTSIHAANQLPEQYGGRLPPTPTYFPATTAAPAQAYSAYSTSSSSQQTTGNARLGSSMPAGPLSSTTTYPPRSYSYPLPALATHAPIMTNLHSPGSPMSLLGSVNPYIPHPMHHPLYAHASLGHGAGHVALNDRPFKCDTCQQSFNRNHDLKRHKRIHLAVKPFPCGHCDKSFSRKDALKRHILVKGCGKSPTSATSMSGASLDERDSEGSISPLDGSEANSPTMTMH